MNLQEVIKEREKTLERIIATFHNMDGVIGMFLSGSIAEGTSDEYSDIDFRVLIDDEHYEEVLSQRLTLPKQWGAFLFNEYWPNTNYCISHYKPFFKVDVFYYRVKDLLPSPWFNRGIKVIFDKNFIISRIVKESEDLTFNPTQLDVEISISKGIAHAHEVYRRIMRGELIYARELLSEIRYRMIEAEDYIHNFAPEGFTRVESRGNKKIIEIINISYEVTDKEEILKSLYELISIYRQQIQKLHNKFNLCRDLAKDLLSIDLLFCHKH